MGQTQTVTVGTRARISNTYLLDGKPYDPAQLALVVIDAGGTRQRYPYTPNGTLLRRSAQGVYYLELLCGTVGTIRYAWESTASGEEIVTEGKVTVGPRTVS